MTNLYWPVYKNLESELNSLMFNIHIDDNQLSVYSSKIADLILRTVIEIESLSKELYKIHGGVKTDFLKFDDDCIRYLNKVYMLENKEVIISSVNCFQAQRIIKPFVKLVTRTGSSKKTFSWNNSYQNLKHDRANAITHGNLGNLFDGLAALFLLNVYYKNERIHIGKQGDSFSPGLGSDIFSIKLLASYGIQYLKDKVTDPTFYSHTYMVVPDNDSGKAAVQQWEEFNKKRTELMLKSLLDKIQKDPSITLELNPDEPMKFVNSHVDQNIFVEAMGDPKRFSQALLNMQYDAIIITKDFPLDEVHLKFPKIT